MAYRDPEAFARLIERIVEATVEYLDGQIAAGVHAVQLFESWSGSLAPDQFERWVIGPTRAIVRAIKAKHPNVPVIGFPKGAGGKLRDYADGTMIDAIGIDETVDPLWADAVLPPSLPVQGNLDPLALLAGGAALENAVSHIRQAFAGRPHVFNLGHGILPQVPIAHVERLLELVRA
jgi:uroporphyrinogen decarboxylase